MTIQATPSEQSYAADGVSTVFAIPFPFDTSADIKITSTDASGNILTLSTGFTISGGAGSTGNATFSVAPAAGLTITIYDDPARTQPTDYVSLDAFPAESHERALDRVTRLTKRLYQLVQRSVRFPDGDVSTDGVLGSVATRKGKYLFFNAVTGAIEYAANVVTTALSQSLIGQLLYPQTTSENAAGITPSNLAYHSWDWGSRLEFRYGADGLGGANDATAVAITKRSTVLGFGALKKQLLPATSTGTGPLNVAIGYQALQNSIYGGGGLLNAQGNTAVGAQAMSTGTARGDYNTAVGYLALTNATDSYCNTGIGLRALTALTASQYNTGVGCDAGNGIGSGNENTAVGAKSMLMPLGGSADHNTCCGSSSGYNLSTGNWNTLIGNNAGLSFTIGANNTAVGALALNQNITGSDNTAVGYWALRVATGSTNVAVGKNCMGATVGATENVAVGADALSNNTSGNTNTAVGRSALSGNLTGSSATAVGKDALLNATGGLNTAVGYFAGRATVGGTQNVFIGRSCGVANTSGSLSTAVGDGALATATTVSENTAVGYNALALVTGGTNVAVGGEALAAETTGTALTSIGFQAGATQTVGFTNSTNLGNTANSTGSNQVTLGNASIATLRCQVTTITALSDVRFKTDIQPLDLPDAFLDEIEVITFRWISAELPEGVHMGVIAQQLDALQEKYGLQWLGLVDKSNPEKLEATPGKLLFPLIVRAQRQQARLAAFEKRLAALEASRG